MIVLCLVNTYDKLKLHEIHLRTVARAAPLCYAFKMHLALLDFPFWKRVDEMAREVTEYTTIGESGRYLLKLVEEGRLHLIEKLPGHFGVSVATTSKPDPSKSIDIDSLSSIKSATFLIGLGRRGLPTNILKAARYHLDITHQGVSLETCTAIGAIAMLMAIKVVKKWKK